MFGFSDSWTFLSVVVLIPLKFQILIHPGFRTPDISSYCSSIMAFWFNFCKGKICSSSPPLDTPLYTAWTLSNRVSWSQVIISCLRIGLHLPHSLLFPPPSLFSSLMSLLSYIPFFRVRLSKFSALHTLYPYQTFPPSTVTSTPSQTVLSFFILPSCTLFCKSSPLTIISLLLLTQNSWPLP